MAAEQIAFKLSKEAIRMIKSGKAVLTPGGIRSVDSGQILQLARPVMTKTYSQKELLNRVMQSTRHMEAISWVNAGLSLVNIGVSVVGFYLVLNKMNSLQGELRQFIDAYNADQQSEVLREYKDHLQMITNHLSYLQSRYTTPIFDQQDFMIHRIDIENECIRTENFLDKTLTALLNSHMETKLGCQIIFTLAPVYAQLVNEYCCQYYCLCRQQHNQFSSWLSILDQINSELFQTFMKKQMAFNVDYAKLNPQRRKDVLSVAFDGIEELKENMLLCAETIQNAPANTLVPVEYLLHGKIWQDIENKAQKKTGESTEEFFSRKVMQIAIDENDEEIVIPMGTMYH